MHCTYMLLCIRIGVICIVEQCNVERPRPAETVQVLNELTARNVFVLAVAHFVA